MSSRTRTIQETDKFFIRKCTRRSNGKNYYELACNMNYWWENDEVDRVRDILDPTRNRSGQFGRSWKYQSLARAEQALTHLLMVL